MGGEEFADAQLVHDTAGQGKVGESITIDIVIGEEAVSGNGVVKGVKVAFGRVQSGAGQTNKEAGQQATAE